MEPLTSATVVQEIRTCPELERTWLRPAAAAHRASIGRSLLYEHIKNGDIKSVCLRKPNNVRGLRLISASSLEQFIESFLPRETPFARLLEETPSAR